MPVQDGVLVGEGECFDAGYLFIPDGLLNTRIALDLATEQAAEMLDLYERGRIRAVERERALRGSRSMHEGLLNWVHATPNQRADALANLAVRFGLPRPDEDELHRIRDELAESERSTQQEIRASEEEVRRQFGLVPPPPGTTPDQL